eukprot:gene20158-7214_t
MSVMTNILMKLIKETSLSAILDKLGGPIEANVHDSGDGGLVMLSSQKDISQTSFCPGRKTQLRCVGGNGNKKLLGYLERPFTAFPSTFRFLSRRTDTLDRKS